MSLEAMKQALEALEKCRAGFEYTRQYVGYETLPAIEGWSWYDGDVAAVKAITSLRQAIAEAEKQEPVAWMHPEDYKTHFTTIPSEDLVSSGYWQPLYTSPPQRQWVGLTWHDMPNKWVGNIPFTEGAKWAEATLKEKNT